MRPSSPLAALLAIGLLAGPAAAQSLRPFTLPWNDASPGPLDQSSLNGASGAVLTPLTVSNGHLHRDGDRYRIWGVNISFWGGAAPSHAESAAMAARIAKLGFNAVRLHGCDTFFSYPTPNSLIAYQDDSSSSLNEEVFEKLDYLIAQLLERGIYVDWNLYVGRRFLPGDSLDPAAPLPLPTISAAEGAPSGSDGRPKGRATAAPNAGPSSSASRPPTSR